MRRGRTRALIAVAALLGTVAPGPRVEAATKLVTAYAAISGLFAGQWMAQEAGAFARHGLDSSLVYIASSTKIAQAMVAGEVPMALMGGEAVVNAVLGGADLVFVAGVTNRPLFFIVVTGDIQRPSDLKGQALGVSRYGASSDFATRLALRHWGLEPVKDVAILQLGGIPEILAAMKAGGVKGGALSPPTNVRARREGYRELINTAELGFFPHDAIVTTRAFLRTNGDTVRAFIKGYAEGVHRYKTDKTRAMEVLKKYTNVTDPELLAETHALTAPVLEDPPLHLDPRGIQAVLDFLPLPAAKAAKPEDFMDLRILREVEQSGFFKTIR
jgi:ABC-type nitrate/sulfonate/bicarbonate transport system substrate-binding protein